MNQNNPFQPKPTKPKRHHASFIEALKSIGTATTTSLKDDVIKGTASNAINSLIGSHQSTNTENNFPTYQSLEQYSPDSFSPEWFNQQNQENLGEERKRQRLKELNLTPLYDRRQQEIEAQIKALRDELRLLAQELGQLGSSVQIAIDQEIENPGTYHISYFEKLKKFIINLRKQVSQSANWLEISSQRKQAKRYYWGQVKKSGTKYMLSSERNMVTQTG
jgi:hypothetical protein